MVLLKREVIFPFPAVQYIPINLTIRHRFSPMEGLPSIDAGTRTDGFIERFKRRFGFDPDLSELSPDEGLLAVTGLQFREIFYRAYYVTLLSEANADGFMASFPMKYFYKTPLVFQARSENGAILASCPFIVPPGGSRYIRA